jgi:hypothetical protein
MEQSNFISVMTDWNMNFIPLFNMSPQIVTEQLEFDIVVRIPIFFYSGGTWFQPWPEDWLS